MSRNKNFVGIGIPCLLVGGTEIQTLNLAKALVEQDFHVKLICYFEFDPIMVAKFETLGVEVILLRWQRSIGPGQFIKALAKFIRKENFDIFHVQYVAPGALPILAARLAGTKRIIATVHQPYTVSHGRFARLILRTAAKLCNTFLSVSKSTEESWFGSHHVFSLSTDYKQVPKHCTIYNSLDTQAIDLKLNSLPVQQSDPQQISIGTVCRLNYVKGLDTLILAYDLLRSKGIEHTSLSIYGEGEDGPRLQQLVEDLGLGNRVQFYGKLAPDEVITATANFDIVVVPSRFEAFGLYAAEAMAIGKAVIGSDTYGLSEVITDQKTGLLFEVENAEELAGKLELLVLNPTLRNELGKAASQSIKDRFDFEDYKKKQGKLYGLLANS